MFSLRCSVHALISVMLHEIFDRSVLTTLLLIYIFSYIIINNIINRKELPTCTPFMFLFVFNRLQSF